MNPDDGGSSTVLRWTQPTLTARAHELCDPQGRVTSRLAFEATPGLAWGLRNPRVAVVEGGDIRWSFAVQRRGWTGALGLTALVVVTGPQQGQLQARALLTTGRLTLENQLSFVWRSSLARRGGSAFLSPALQPIVEFQPGSFFERVNTFVRLTGTTLSPSHTLLLSGLGLYLRLLMGRPFR